MPYRPVAIANHFIELAERDNKSLTPMQVQKLVFYAHGWHLAIEDEPLIDEQVEAWKFGPVIRSLYATFRDYGSKAIEGKYRQPVLDRSSGGLKLKWLLPASLADIPEQEEFTKALLEKVWAVYGKYTAFQLSNMTHAAGTPWYTVAQQYGTDPIPKGTDIPSHVIRDYFSDLGTRKNEAG